MIDDDEGYHVFFPAVKTILPLSQINFIYHSSLIISILSISPLSLSAQSAIALTISLLSISALTISLPIISTLIISPLSISTQISRQREGVLSPVGGPRATGEDLLTRDPNSGLSHTFLPHFVKRER